MPQTQLQLFNSVVGGKFFLLKLVCTKALYLLLIRCQACSKGFILYNAVISSFCSFYLFRIALVFRFSGTADTYPESMSNLKLHANPALNWSLEKLPWHSIARQRTSVSVTVAPCAAPWTQPQCSLFHSASIPTLILKVIQECLFSSWYLFFIFQQNAGSSVGVFPPTDDHQVFSGWHFFVHLFLLGFFLRRKKDDILKAFVALQFTYHISGKAQPSI